MPSTVRGEANACLVKMRPGKHGRQKVGITGDAGRRAPSNVLRHRFDSKIPAAKATRNIVFMCIFVFIILIDWS